MTFARRRLAQLLVGGGLAIAARASGAPQDGPARLHVSGGEIVVEFAEGTLDVTRPQLLAWVTAGANATIAFFGRFPVAHYKLVIEPSAGDSGVLNGTTWADGGALTRVIVGEHTTVEQLDHDWIMTHEMIHTAFPDQGRSHRWIEEGISTYAEPLSRSWTGHYPPTKVWTDLIENVPKGLPDDGDRGLDHTPTWGRTYWGGAMFCLLADLEIRERTSGRLGLIDALRGILAAGGNDQVDWSIDKTFQIADKAVGVPVLEELYKKMKDKPVTPDLPALWRQLGLSLVHGKLVVDDKAPKAALRRAISAPPAPPTAPAAPAAAPAVDGPPSHK